MRRYVSHLHGQKGNAATPQTHPGAHHLTRGSSQLISVYSGQQFLHGAPNGAYRVVSMGKGTPKDAIAIREATRVLMDAPTQKRAQAEQQAPLAIPELSATELLQQPTQTLNSILLLLDKFLKELHKRTDEGSASRQDMRAFVDLVKAHAALRQTQLAEDEFTRKNQALTTDTDVALLLVEAMKAGGQEAVSAMREALALLEPER